MFDVRPMPPSLDKALIEHAHLAEPATFGHSRFLGFPDCGLKAIANPLPRAGTVVTLALPALDSTLLHHAVEMLRPTDFLIVDRLGDTRFACLGGGVATGLARAGIAGIIVDGPCADPDELAATGLSVWARGTTALTTRVHGLGGAMNVPVSIGGAVAMPGDLVIADAGGIVFLPRAEAKAAVAEAIAYQDKAAMQIARVGIDQPLGRMTGASDLVERSLKR